MALTKDAKKEVIDEVSSLLSDAKMTVIAAYPGTSVKAMQQLRRDAKPAGTVVKVLKNRLVIKAIQSNDSLKDIDTTGLKGQLLYAFNGDDEVAPAQALANFAKTNPTLEFVGAISADGKFLGVDEVKALATLPSKPELIAQVLATLSSPANDVMSALGGGLSAILSGLEAKAS